MPLHHYSIMIGRPVHFQIKSKYGVRVACGVAAPEHYGWDGRSTECLRCRKTRAFRTYMGKK